MQNENTPTEGQNSDKLEAESALRDAACSRFGFDQSGYEKLIITHGEQNVETGGEDFCAPWWDAECQCWCVAARYADCGLRQYADGWEWALNGMKYPSAMEAYERRNDEFHSANERVDLPPKKGGYSTSDVTGG
jgi:hypothetical protein